MDLQTIKEVSLWSTAVFMFMIKLIKFTQLYISMSYCKEVPQKRNK
jgi:hypothetical protein